MAPHKPRMPWLALALLAACVICTRTGEALADSPLSWSSPAAVDAPNVLYGVSCPTASLCVAVDSAGNVVTSTDPTGGPGAWAVTNIDGFFIIDAISCPSAAFCVAGDNHGNVLTSINPAGGAAAWHKTSAGSGPVAISCPSTSLCAATDGGTNVLISTDPGAASPTWTLTSIDTNPMFGISCPSTSLCVATDDSGHVLSSTNPTAATPTWTTTDADGTAGLYEISCPSTSLCAAADDQGNVVTSTDPGSPTPTWTAADVDGTHAMYGISCISSSLCVATDFFGNVITSTSPTGGAGAWTVTNVDGTSTIYGISCPTLTLCVASDAGGQVLTGTSATQHSLGVSIVGSGSVTGSGISCPGTCSKSYPDGAGVTLTATPAPGFAFVGWSGDCGGSGTCNLTMGSDHSITATFSPRYTLTETNAGAGTGLVSGSAGFLCFKTGTAPSTCSLAYPSGTVETLHAKATGGSAFTGWSGDCSGTADCILPMNADHSATATFAKTATLTVKFSGSGTGVVTGPSIRCPPLAKVKGLPSCSATYVGGTAVTLHASAAAGSRFTGWSGPCGGSGACNMTMSASRTVTARFERDYGIQLNAIEVTQGVQTPELPTRSATNPSGFRVAYTGVNLPWQSVDSPPVTVELAEHHATVVRVYANTRLPLGGAPPPPVVLTALRDGKPLAPGPIEPDGPPSSSALPVGALGNVDPAARYNPTGAYTFTLPWTWTTGDVTLVADANPAPSSFPTCAAACQEAGIILDGVHFNPVTSAQIDPLAFYVNTGFGGCTRSRSTRIIPGKPCYPSGYPAVDPAWLETQAVTPFPIYVSPYKMAYDATTTVTKQARTDYIGASKALLALVENWANDNDKLSSHFPFGVVPANLGYSGGLTDAGSSGSPRILYGDAQPRSEASEDRPITAMAHEMNHGLGRPHAGVECGSGQDPNEDAAAAGGTADSSDDTGQVGEPWGPVIGAADGLFDGVGLDTNGSYPYAIIHSSPANFTSAGATIFDLMSYCGGEGNAWISVRNWNRDVEFRAPGAIARAAAAAPVYSTDPPATVPGGHALAITAVSDPSAGQTTIDSVALDSGAPTPAQPGGVYTLVGRDAGRQVIATAGALASEAHIDHAPSDVVIVGKLPAAGVREVDILQSGSQIAALRASAHAPTVAIVAPRAGARLGGPRGLRLRWRSTDADGGTRQATVRYSPDGGHSWHTIYVGADRGSVGLPSGLLSASRNARVRVYISDGFNEAIATSRRFVARGAPPVVSITTPRRGTRVDAGAPLDLAGIAFDDAGRQLSGRSLTWRARGRVIGRGSRAATVSLPAGRYRITLSVRDRHGRTGSASVPVRVVASPPVLRMLSVPRRVSAKARALTIRVASLAPAKLAIGHTRARIGRARRRLRVRIRPGRTPLTLALVLRSGRFVTTLPVTVTR